MGEFNWLKIPILKCIDPDAYIEVGLRATPKSDGSESLSKSKKEKSVVVDQEQMKLLLSELEMEKKELKRLREDYDHRIKDLVKKENALATQLENTKSEIAYQQKVQHSLENDKSLLEQDKETLQRKLNSKDEELESKAQQVEDTRHDLQMKIKELDAAKRDLEDFKDSKEQHMKAVRGKVERAKQDKLRMYNMEMFDTNYMGSIIKLFSKRAIP